VQIGSKESSASNRRATAATNNTGDLVVSKLGSDKASIQDGSQQPTPGMSVLPRDIANRNSHSFE